MAAQGISREKITRCEFPGPKESFQPWTGLPEDEGSEQEFARVGVREMVRHQAVQLVISRQVGGERQRQVMLERGGGGED